MHLSSKGARIIKAIIKYIIDITPKLAYKEINELCGAYSPIANVPQYSPSNVFTPKENLNKYCLYNNQALNL